MSEWSDSTEWVTIRVQQYCALCRCAIPHDVLDLCAYVNETHRMPDTDDGTRVTLYLGTLWCPSCATILPPREWSPEQDGDE
jgi:hypothetical protein